MAFTRNPRPVLRETDLLVNIYLTYNVPQDLLERLTLSMIKGLSRMICDSLSSYPIEIGLSVVNFTIE